MAHRDRTRLLLPLLIILIAGCSNPPSPPVTLQATAPAAPNTTALADASDIHIKPYCPNARGPLDAPIIFGNGNNLNMIQPDGSGLQPVFDLPITVWAHEPSWSPDGSTLAYMFSLPATKSEIPGLQISLICGVDRVTGTGRVLMQGGDDTEAFEEPTWTGDGRALIATRRVTSADPETGYIGSKQALVRFELTGGEPKMLVEEGLSPAISPDGEQLVFVRYDPQTFDASLLLARSDGTAGQPIAQTQPPFGVFTAPRWSPDRAFLTFSASRGPAPAAPPPAEIRSLLEIVLDIQVAQAHGEPATLWMVDNTGQNLCALSAHNLDDPRGAWSPDGTSMALAAGSGGGVSVINLATLETRRITDQGDFGGISWAPDVAQ